MLKKTILASVCLLLIPMIAAAQFIRPKILRGGDAFGAAAGDPWKATWIGTGGKAIVDGLEDQAIPVSGEDKKIDLKAILDPAVVFVTPQGAKKGSLKMKFNVNGDWISFCVAPSDPWAWSTVDISKCDTLMIWVKGGTGTETWSFKAKAGDAEGKDIKIVNYLPAQKITTEWQQAIIPLKDLIDITKADLTKFASLCGSLAGEGDCTLFIDNIIFYKATVVPTEVQQVSPATNTVPVPQGQTP